MTKNHALKKIFVILLIVVFQNTLVYSQDSVSSEDKVSSVSDSEIKAKTDEVDALNDKIKQLEAAISTENDIDKKNQIVAESDLLIAKRDQLIAEIKKDSEAKNKEAAKVIKTKELTEQEKENLALKKKEEERLREQAALINAKLSKQKEERLREQEALINAKLSKQKEQEARVKKQKKEAKEKLIIKIKKVSDAIKVKKAEIAKIDEDIDLAVKAIIETVKREDIDKLIEKKSNLILKKTNLEKEYADLNTLKVSLDEKLKKKDDGFELAEGTLNWNKVYDIETIQRSKPGTWNISVQARDSMNNTSAETAINVKVDPKSDIPRLNIINPKPMARVPGNLMVVGTAFDDDEVKKVVMWVDNEKKEVECSGKDFWYYDLDTSKMEDGVHKLTFKVFDIKDVASKKYEVLYVLDRKVPLITVDTINSGSVVSGKKKIGGVVSDMNGIRFMEYSLDDRYSFSRIPNVGSAVGGMTKGNWNFTLNTDLLLSGTQVVWIKAVDSAGSEGYFPLTLIVDREKPVVGFNYPANKDKIGDRFTVYGYAKDNVDIKSVNLKIKFPGFSEKEQPVKIIPGNPFWKFSFDVASMGDVTKLKSGNCIVTAIVTDVADNVVTKDLLLSIDTELEKPKVALKSVNKGDSFSGEIPLYGPVKDDDEVRDVLVHLYNDKNEAVSSKVVDSKYSFSTTLDVSDISEGEYTVQVTPRDYFVQGDAIKEKIWIDRSAPLFDIDKINKIWGGKTVNGKLDLDFSVIKFGEMPVVEYAVVDALKGNIEDKGSIKLKSSGKLGVFDAEKVTLDFFKDKKIEGMKLIRLTATDKAMKRSEVSIPVFIDFTPPVISDVKINDKTGLMDDVEVSVSDNQVFTEIEVVQGSSLTNKPVVVKIKNGEQKEFVMAVKNAEGKFNTFDYDIKVSDSAGNQTVVKYKIRFKDTTKSELKLAVKSLLKDKTSYSDKTLIFMPDDKMINPDEMRYCYGFTPFDISELRLNFGKDRNIPLKIVNKDTGIFMADISPDIRKDFNIGENVLTYSVEKAEGGGADIRSLRYYNDLSIPQADIIWPPAYLPVNSNVTIYGIADDDSGIDAVYAGIDTTNDAKLTRVDIEPIAGIKNYRVPFIDPLTRGQTQTIGEYLSNKSIKIYEKGNAFKFNFQTERFNSGEHIVRFKIVDKAGKVLYRNTVIYVDKTLPGIKVIAPSVDEKLNGVISIRGDASDDTGIANVIFEMNDKFVMADGYNVWDGLYDLYERNEYDPKNKDLTKLDLSVVAIDFAGNRRNVKQSVTLDQFNDIPTIYINSPAVDEQRYTTDTVKFEGVALDDDGIESVQYRIDSGLDELEGNGLGGSSEGGWRTVILKENEKPNWSVTMVPGFLKPGLHTLEVRAYDIGFLASEVKKIQFQIDKENPKIEITGPQNGSYFKGLKLINGKSSDPNEIGSIDVSTNNGWTFVPAEGKENWKYYLDTATLPDGALKFLIKAKDRSGSESYSFSVYNIDNTPPELNILLPKDGMRINNKYRIVGRAKDNIMLDKGFIKITQNSRNMLQNTDEEGFVQVVGTNAWYYDIDATKWDQGQVYHLIVKMYDMAGNVTEKSMDFYVDIRSDFPVVELDQPQSGQHLTGEMIEFYGTSYDDDGIEAVYLEIDGNERVLAEGTTQWKYCIPSVKLLPGVHKVTIVAQEVAIDGVPGKFSQSVSRSFFIDDSGIIINITSNVNGDSVGHRPWITGSAKYYEKDLELKIKKEIQTKKYYELKKEYKDTPEKITELDKIEVSTSEVISGMNSYLAKNKIEAVYMSYDNGNSYKRQWGSIDGWQNRLQTQYLKDGVHMLQFKAVTAAGKETLKYFKVKIDRQIPSVIIDVPTENKPVNEQILVSGSSDDNNTIEEVKVRFKRFDKNLGKLPKFIEGMYLWAQVLGGPLGSGGFGFSFFDNIVRLEGLFAWFPTEENLNDMGLVDNQFLFNSDNGWTNNRFEPRFSGFSAGGKLLARVIDLPFEFFGGEDFKNFSISVEIGAGFYWVSGFAAAKREIDGSYYRDKRANEELLTGISSKTDGYNAQKDAKVLAGFMYQIDFLKIERYGILKNFALYFENSFYFISSEVESTLTPQFGFGVRNSLF